MARSKQNSKPHAKRTPKKPDGTTLVQARIPTEDHVRLARMCDRFEQSTAARLKSLVARELEDTYPKIVVTGKKGDSRTTFAIIAKHAVPEMVGLHVIVTSTDAKGIFPEMLAEKRNEKKLRFALPMCTPRVYSLASSVVDVKGDWYLHLVEDPKLSRKV